MDMVFQSFVALFGSVILAGCLTEPTITEVPDTGTEEIMDANETDLVKLTPELQMSNPRITPDLAIIRKCGIDLVMACKAMAGDPCNHQLVSHDGDVQLSGFALLEFWDGSMWWTGKA